jgi:hypothetical protein
MTANQLEDSSDTNSSYKVGASIIQTYSSSTIKKIDQEVPISSDFLTKNPAKITCPHCCRIVTTTVEYQSGWPPWLACGITFLSGFWFCCFVPFVIDSLMDIAHKCPVCGFVIVVIPCVNLM